MARDDLPPLAAREAAPEVAVERRQPGRKGPRLLGLPSACADPRTMRGVAERVEPDVRIASRADQRQPVEEVERPAVRAVDGSLERRLEAAAEVEDEVGGADALDVARRELDVVRLGAGRREVRDGHPVAADLLGRVRERIEAGDDRRCGRRRRRRAAAAGSERDERRR